jgi:sulfite exporter TauE/SafE
MMEYISALLLGLLGSLHCAGMCGPIAVALPLNNEIWLSRIFGGMLYNTGRILTYAAMGAVFGLAGKGLALGGLQQWISIILGITMIILVLVPKLGSFGGSISHLTDHLTAGMKKSFGKLFTARTYRSLFTIGLLNGFLPCGLVYIALAGAVVTGESGGGALYMVIFGLGTIPVLFGIAMAGNLLAITFRRKITRIIPYFIVLLGLLFILRGMNLGIPYVSPKISKSSETTTMECCKPKK